MPENSRSTLSISAEMRSAHRRIGIEHHYFVEERVHDRPQRGNRSQRFAVERA